jgi:hypothetical protein
MPVDRPRHHDPGSRFEDAGIPDLQDGTPEQQWAEDPEEMPLPGERPNASIDWGTTAEEQFEGEPHDGRLKRERPDPALTEIGDDLEGTSIRETGGRKDARGIDPAADVDLGGTVDTGYGIATSVDEIDSRRQTEVGRLVNDQILEPGDLEPDTEAADVGMDAGGLTAEERAMHIEPD